MASDPVCCLWGSNEEQGDALRIATAFRRDLGGKSLTNFGANRRIRSELQLSRVELEVENVDLARVSQSVLN